MTTRASAAPIQRVLRESGIPNPLPLANKKPQDVETTLNTTYSVHPARGWWSVNCRKADFGDALGSAGAVALIVKASLALVGCVGF